MWCDFYANFKLGKITALGVTIFLINITHIQGISMWHVKMNQMPHLYHKVPNT